MELAIEGPAWGQAPMANELKKRGMTISPAGVRCVWLRHDLENIKKGLKTLAAKSLHESLILTERANGNLGESQRDQRGSWGNSRANVLDTVEHRIPSM